MRKPMVRSMLLAAVLACSPLAFAAAPQAASAPVAAPQSQQQRQPKDLFDQLGLTDAQRSSAHQLIQQSFQETQPETQTLHQKEIAFGSTTPGSAAFKAATNDFAQAATNAAHAEVMRQADLRTKIYNLLTSEQRTKLASLIQQRQQEMRQRAAAPAASH